MTAVLRKGRWFLFLKTDVIKIMKRVVILFILIVGISCRQNDSKNRTTNINGFANSSSANIVSDTLEATAFADSTIIGAYEGTFPCKDCDSIRQIILFKADHNFSQEQILAKGQSLHKSSGEWRTNGEFVELFQNHKKEIVFRFKNDTLFAININDVPVTDSLKYMLSKRALASDNTAWEPKRSEGVEFIGIGNEPFWNIEIQKEKIKLKMADWNHPVAGDIRGIENSIDSTVYHIISNKMEWTIIILPQFCSDGMSDFLYEYKVEVTYDGRQLEGCGILL